MADRREGRPRSARELIEEMSSRSDLRYGARRVDAVDALRESLDEVLGAGLAARCRIDSIFGTEARITCRDNSTAMRVRFYVPDILKAVASRLDAADVVTVRVTVGMHGWDDA